MTSFEMVQYVHSSIGIVLQTAAVTASVISTIILILQFQNRGNKK